MSTTSPTVRRDPVLLGLIALGVAQAAWVGWCLRVPDLNLHYPFPGGDGWDWISNALALSGEPVRYTGRPPLFPLLIASLESMHASRLLPFLQQIALAAVAWISYASVRGRHGRRIAGVVALCVLANETLLRQALGLMAEPLAAALLAGACAAFIAARERPRLYLVAGLLDGLAILTQPVTVLFLLAAGATLLARRRAHLRRHEPWIGAAIAAAMALSWTVAKPLWMGAAGEHDARAWSLLRLHLDSVAGYARVAVDVAGWPVLLLIGLALARLALANATRSTRPAPPPANHAPHARPTSQPTDAPSAGDDALFFTGLLAAGLLVFFVFAYDFFAERFLIYVMVPALWWLAAGLAVLRPLAPRAIAGAAAILLVAWPRPSLAAHPWVDVARFAREPHAFETLDAKRFADASTVVYLERPGGAEDSRWRAVYRLGNALRRRVKTAPAALYPRDWWGWRCLDRAIEIDDYVLARWSCPGAPVVAVMAWGRRAPPAVAQRARTERAAASTQDLPPPSFPAEVADGWERARRIDAELAQPDGFLVAFLERGSRPAWLQALPFVARTTSLVIAPRRGATAGLGDELARGPTLAEWETAGCRLRRTRHRAYAVLVVLGCDGQ